MSIFSGHLCAGVIKNKGCDVIAINGMEDHIHILIDLHPAISLSDLVKNIKVSATKMIKETRCFPMYEGWAAEYFACSVSPAHLEAVKNYILGQEEHHKSKGFDIEIEDFVNKMGLTLYKGNRFQPLRGCNS